MLRVAMRLRAESSSHRIVAVYLTLVLSLSHGDRIFMTFFRLVS